MKKKLNELTQCLCFSLLLGYYFLILLFLNAFSTNSFGQIAIPVSKLHSNFPTDTTFDMRNVRFKVFNDQSYTVINSNLWAFSKDGKISKIDVFTEDIYAIEPFENQLLVVTDKGLRILNLEGEVKIIEGVEGTPLTIEAFGNRTFIGTSKGLWSVNKNGEVINERIEGSIPVIEPFNNQLLVITNEGILWIVSEVDKANIGNVRGRVNIMQPLQDRLLISTAEKSWLLGKNNKLNDLQIYNNGYVDFASFGNQLFAGIDERLVIIYQNDKITEGTEAISGSGVIGERWHFKKFGEQIFIATNVGVWSSNNDNIKRENIEGETNGLEVFGDQLFIGTSKGLQVIDKNNEVSRDEVVEGEVNSIELFDDLLFVSSDKGLWSFTKDKKRSKIGGIEGNNAIESIKDQLLVYSDNGSWVIDKNGKVSKAEKITDTFGNNQVGNYYYFQNSGDLVRFDPKTIIKTELAPTDWWEKALNSILPSWLLFAEKVEVKATYSDETGKDPYDATVLKGFRFAEVDGDALPSDSNFSASNKPFSYEIGWGRNNIQYWVKDNWGNTFKTPAKNIYYGFPSRFLIPALPVIFSVFSVLSCFALAPKVGFCHSAIMNPWLRKYFSLGSVPLLVSVFPSLRRYILRRYANSVSEDKEFTEWKTRFVSPNEDFLPENFGKKLNDERRLLLTGQSGIGKTVFFKYLTACYVSENKPPLPAKVFPVYISLTNYGGNSLEELVYNQLFAYGKITDKELAPMFLEQGGLLIFLDGVNEVQNVADRRKLSEFVEKYWTSNYICLSSQQTYPEIENIPKVELKTFSSEKVAEFIKHRANDKEKAEKVIESLTLEDYQLYSVPRDLEFAVAILNDGEDSLPKSRTALYKTVFSFLFAKWKENGRDDAENILCEHAYTMIATRDLAFDTVENPKFEEITTDLFEQKFLIKREKNYNFRHDLIRSYLASDYFYPRWQNLFARLENKQIDSNWLEMLKFSCENIEKADEVKNLVYQVLEKSIRKDLVKNLVIWLKANHPNKCKSWEKDFYTKYGELDFKPEIEENNKMKKILFVMANPLETTRLRLDKEFREVDNGLRLSNLRNQFELEISTATRPNDLRREMLRYSPQFVHFSGHGETEGIVLENDNGNSQIVETGALAELFSLFSEFTECVVLNSCFSENQAKAICEYIPFVVGMNKAVPDNTAIQFAIGFYDAIGAGRKVEDAFKFGKNAIDLNSIGGEDIPVLMKK